MRKTFVAFAENRPAAGYRRIGRFLRYAPSAWNVLLLVGLVWFLLDAYLSEPYLSYKNLPAPVMNMRPIKAGQTVVLAITRCNADNHAHNYTTTRELVALPSRTLHILTSTTVTINPGCEWILSRANELPADTPPGRYRVQGMVELPDRMRTHFVTWQSAEFDVE